MSDVELLLFLAGLSYLASFSFISFVKVFILAVKINQWLPAECALTHLEVKPQVGGVELSGLGSTGEHTNQIVAVYKYKMKASEYTGQRVNILDEARSFGMPNIVNYDKELWETLSNSFHTNKIVSGWVSPSDPKQSILTKRIYYGRLFLLIAIFMTTSAGVIYFWSQI